MKTPVVVSVLLAVACAGNSGPAGGPVAGPVDAHCTLADGGMQAQPLNPASCHLTGGIGTVDYGPTLHGSEADDDDCKYHVSFTSTPVYENTNVTFTLVATEKATGKPATGANLVAEVFLSATHPAPNSGQKATESPPGTYQIGPVRFDAKGQWTVRFHLREECTEASTDSPHGHVAFYLQVP
jgi:hypothetical protein